jgi:replicative DNA helicase
MKTKTGNIPPSDIEVEKIVLGTILIDYNIIDTIISDFSEHLFFKYENMLIAKAIISLYKENKKIDFITVINKLTQIDKLSDVGGHIYISSLTNGISGSYNIDFYIRILQEESLRRKLLTISQESLSKSLDKTIDIFDVFNETQSKLDNSIKDVINYEIKSVGQINDDLIQQSILLFNSGQKSGVPSGLNMVDNVTNGWQKSDLIILAGRPGMGKTSAAVSMCIYPALQEKKAVAIFSLEMSSEQLVSRMQSFVSGVNVSLIVKKKLTENQIHQIQLKSKELAEAPIYIDDTPNITLLDLKGKARKLVKEQKVEMIVIDYLQLMRSGLKTKSREEEIAEISRGLKGLAKELKIPIIALAQLSRSVEQRGGDKKPMLSDLRESGQIEQDADMVLFCYRPEYYGISDYQVGNTEFDTNGLFFLLIAKHRNGELGEIPLTFIAEQTKIVNHNQFNYSENRTSSNNISTFVQQETFNTIQPNVSFEKNEFSKEIDLEAGDVPF